MHIATIRETAKHLRIGLSSLYKKIKTDPTFPHSFKVGGKPVFNLDSIDEWVLEQERKANAKGNEHVRK